MSWVITGSQPFPAVIGEAFGGGYFAGYISHTADGSPTHALIVAPAGTGASGTGYTLSTNLLWKTSAAATTPGTTSAFDGVVNAAAIVTAGIADHPAAEFCKNLSIGGYTDWYLPSPSELDIAYFNLKADSTANDVSWGINAYSVPKRASNNISSYPTTTSVALFAGGAQSFGTAPHWSSQSSGTNAWTVEFAGGRNIVRAYNNAGRSTRAFRRITL
jgi:hypothetical protein